MSDGIITDTKPLRSLELADLQHHPAIVKALRHQQQNAGSRLLSLAPTDVAAIAKSQAEHNVIEWVLKLPEQIYREQPK